MNDNIHSQYYLQLQLQWNKIARTFIHFKN